MGKTGDGVKAGAIAGIVYGIISTIFAIVSLSVFKSQIMSTLNSYLSGISNAGSLGITAQSIYNLEFVLVPVVDIIAGIIVGLILGIIFAAVYHKLPGSSGAVKGIIFGIILWIILGLLLNIGNLHEYGASYFGLSVGGALVAALIYGYVMGILFAKWQASSVVPMEEPPYPKSES